MICESKMKPTIWQVKLKLQLSILQQWFRQVLEGGMLKHKTAFSWSDFEMLTLLPLSVSAFFLLFFHPVSSFSPYLDVFVIQFCHLASLSLPVSLSVSHCVSFLYFLALHLPLWLVFFSLAVQAIFSAKHTHTHTNTNTPHGQTHTVQAQAHTDSCQRIPVIKPPWTAHTL